MGLDEAFYFEDFGVHRNEDGELVVRQAVPEGDVLVHKEVEYWLNTNGSLSGAGRYDIDTNANDYDIIHINS
jgi:hypothetical protein